MIHFLNAREKTRVNGGAATLALLLIAGGLTSSCAKEDTVANQDVVESASEVAASAMSGAVNASEGSTSSAALDSKNLKNLMASHGFWQKVFEKGSDWFLAQAMAADTCPILKQSTCVGNIATLNYSGCAFVSGGATWTGSQLVTFDNAGDCATATTSSIGINALVGTASFMRGFGTGTTRVGVNGVTVTLDNGASGYSQSVSGAISVQCAGGCANQRSIAIGGLHLVASKASATRWDHTVSTTSSITVTGTGATRTITGGTMLIQHNLAHYTGIVQIQGPLKHSLGCCFPVSGGLKTTLSGGTLDGKTETLAFGPTCGSATLTAADGSQSSLSLGYCF